MAVVPGAAATDDSASAAAASGSQPLARKFLIGLIGAGIQRSLSPELHEQEARAQGLRLHYQLIDLDRSPHGVRALPGLVEAARTMGFAGLNITFPCKQAVIPLLDALSDDAAAMGAVNTIVFRADRGVTRAIGHNTDGSGWAWGFRRALPRADLSRVVLLGAGGAGSAIAHAVLRSGADSVVLVDREAGRAEAAAASLCECYGPGRVVAKAEIERALVGASGLIHATPTGMDKLPGLPLPAALLRPPLWVSEIVYFPLETALLRAARAAGCAVCDGGTMAVGQAVGAFELFTDREPDPERMHAHFLSLVTSRGNG